MIVMNLSQQQLQKSAWLPHRCAIGAFSKRHDALIAHCVPILRRFSAISWGWNNIVRLRSSAMRLRAAAHFGSGIVKELFLRMCLLRAIHVYREPRWHHVRVAEFTDSPDECWYEVVAAHVHAQCICALSSWREFRRCWRNHEPSTRLQRQD